MGNELIDKYAFEAVDLIRKKEVSSSELLKASQERHIEVDKQVNALPYTFYDKALTKAKNIKKTLVDHGKGIKAMDATRLQLMKRIKSLEKQIKALKKSVASSPKVL